MISQVGENKADQNLVGVYAYQDGKPVPRLFCVVSYEHKTKGRMSRDGAKSLEVHITGRKKNKTKLDKDLSRGMCIRAWRASFTS